MSTFATNSLHIVGSAGVGKVTFCHRVNGPFLTPQQLANCHSGTTPFPQLLSVRRCDKPVFFDGFKVDEMADFEEIVMSPNSDVKKGGVYYAIVMFSFDDEDSFLKVEGWVKCLQEYAAKYEIELCTVIVGNKFDIADSELYRTVYSTVKETRAPGTALSVSTLYGCRYYFISLKEEKDAARDVLMSLC